MGKESSLRKSSVEGNRREHTNGDRKLFDPDAAPAGVNEDIWDLAKVFEKGALVLGITLSDGLPVIYELLYRKISETFPGNPLTNPPGCAIHRYHSTGSTPVLVVRSNKDYRVVDNYNDIVVDEVVLLTTDIIDYYYNNYYSDIPPNINNFCSNFSNNYSIVIRNNYYTYLKTSGIWVPETDRSVQPDRHPRKVQETLDILVRRVYSEEEMEKRRQKWKEDHA